jgi:hypothetical protein
MAATTTTTKTTTTSRMRLKKCEIEALDYAFIHRPYAHCDLTCFLRVVHARRARWGEQTARPARLRNDMLSDDSATGMRCSFQFALVIAMHAVTRDASAALAFMTML